MSDLQTFALRYSTNTPPSSTVFACVRASSLGLAVSDLSWVYCWAAIWGNIELGFGILGAVRSPSPFTPPTLHHKANDLSPKTEPRPLPHILRLLQTRPQQPHLQQNPLHLQRLPKQPPPTIRPSLERLRHELRPQIPQIEILPQPQQLQPPLISNPNAQLRPLANLGRFAREQILARSNPSRTAQQQRCAQQ